MSTDDRPTVPFRSPPGADALPTEADPFVDLDEGGEAGGMFLTGGFADRYRGGTLIGAGGMGEVRLFADRATGRAVAVKTIRGDRGGVAMRRFAREARIQAQLEHPAIVPVYDLGIDAAGALYFTMKRVRGESLAAVLASLRAGDAEVARRYSRRKLLAVVATVALAVEYAHSRGVFHRDLKPANVMLGPFGEVYVLDWGLAAVAGTPDLEPSGEAPLDLAAAHVPLIDSSQRPQTASGQMLGTPGYLAPEQARGACAPDRSADVYALGCILYEVLTYRRLHLGETLAEVLVSTLSLDGASPLERVPEAAVPPELDTLCRRATRREPDQRLASAKELADALEAYLDGDRDLERRRALAARSAEVASAALARARRDESEDAAARSEALRELTTALAFDPDNAAARAALLRVLTEPSLAAERAASEADHVAEIAAMRVASRNAIFAQLTYGLYVPILLWMGVRSWPMFGVMATAIVAVIVASYYYYRRPPANGRLPTIHVVLTSAAVASGVVLFGPLVLLPTIVLATSIAYIATVNHRHALVVGAAALLVIVPVVLEWLGWIPASFVFERGEIHLLPDLARFPPTATWALLLVAHVVVIVTCDIFVARLRRGYRDAQHRLRAQAWQLAQLVPPDSRPALP